ncbi:hypothetical protein VPH35_139411 [Triticum aestivum]
MVRRRISSSRDRVRLAAVCRPWHDAASRLPAQPAVPALILSPYGRSKKKHMCGPCDSWVLRVPGKAVRKRFVGSHHGGWIAAKDDHQLVIVNLFSGVEVPLTANQKMIASIPTVKGPHNIKKIIFSEDPASSDGCVLAAITHEGYSNQANGKAHKQKWAHVTNFGEYALFLGLSRAVPVPVGGHHGIKRNHIYYYSPTTEEELPDDKVYSIRTGRFI